jgi:hypothetical protein
MGATADAKAVGAQMGVNANNSMAYAGTGASVTGSYGALGSATRAYRGVAAASAAPTASTSFFSSIGVAAIDDEGNIVADDDDDSSGETSGKLAGPKGPLP